MRLTVAKRFVRGMEAQMWAVVTHGTGGFDMLQYKQVPKPVPKAGEVLIQVPLHVSDSGLKRLLFLGLKVA